MSTVKTTNWFLKQLIMFNTALNNYWKSLRASLSWKRSDRVRL